MRHARHIAQLAFLALATVAVYLAACLWMMPGPCTIASALLRTWQRVRWGEVMDC